MDNAKVNKVTEKIECLLVADYNKHHSDTQYDIVVANILSGPLAELSPTLAHHTRAGGDIILSGILKEQADAVLDSYRDFFKMDTPEFEEDWVLLHGVKI